MPNTHFSSMYDPNSPIRHVGQNSPASSDREVFFAREITFILTEVIIPRYTSFATDIWLLISIPLGKLGGRGRGGTRQPSASGQRTRPAPCAASIPINSFRLVTQLPKESNGGRRNNRFVVVMTCASAFELPGCPEAGPVYFFLALSSSIASFQRLNVTSFA
jgi:hypothetical protein